MKVIEWRPIAELIGIAAIVASLIFVGLQMKQSQQIALADQYQARAEAAQDMYMSLQESGMSLLSIAKPIDEMSPAERHTAENVSRWGWTQYDNHYYQYSLGFLDEESWHGLRPRIEEEYFFCDLRSVWEYMQRFLRPSFVEYVESLNDPCENLN